LSPEASLAGDGEFGASRGQTAVHCHERMAQTGTPPLIRIAGDGVPWAWEM